MPSGKCSSISTAESALNSQTRLPVPQCAALTGVPWCVAASWWQLAVRTEFENSPKSSTGRGGGSVGKAESRPGTPGKPVQRMRLRNLSQEGVVVMKLEDSPV